MSDPGHDRGDRRAALIEAIRNGSQEIGTTLTALLFICLLFLATIIETSHADILLNTSKPLPHVGTQLPLVGIFTIVPAAITLLHLIAILQVRGLVLRVRDLSRERRRRAAGNLLHDDMPPALVGQWIVAERRGVFSSSTILSFVAGMALVVVPLGTLLLAQFRFLPYHNAEVTCFHRILILLDGFALATLLRLAWRGDEPSGAPDNADEEPAAHPARLAPTRTWSTAAGAFTVAVVVVALTVATVPDGRMEDVQASVAERLVGVERNCDEWSLNPLTWMSATSRPRSAHHDDAAGNGPAGGEMLCATWLLTENPATSFPFTRRNLSLREAVITEATPSKWLIEELGPKDAWRSAAGAIRLAGRDLRYADLTGATLRGIVFRGANLRGARLGWAKLAYADFGDIMMSEIGHCDATAVRRVNGRFYCRTTLEDANLNGAQLEYSDWHQSRFEGATLSKEISHMADFRGAVLTEMDLQEHELPGARLPQARLTRANLSNADLRAADLRRTFLIDPDLRKADLKGADLKKAHLLVEIHPHTETAPKLVQLELDGADLRDARIALAPTGWTDADASHLAHAGTATFWTALAEDGEVTAEDLESEAVAPPDEPYRGREVGLDRFLALFEAPARSLLDFEGARVFDLRSSAAAGSRKHDREDVDQAGDGMADALADLACNAEHEGVVVGVARRLVQAREEDAEGNRSMRPYEVAVATRLLQEDCGVHDSLPAELRDHLSSLRQRWHTGDRTDEESARLREILKAWERGEQRHAPREVEGACAEDRRYGQGRASPPAAAADARARIECPGSLG